jgi:hypothetical protein
MSPNPTTQHGGQALSHRTCAIVAMALVLAVALGTPTSGLAETGSVYYHGLNVAAGQDFFSGATTGIGNVGISQHVMPGLTTGNSNVGLGNGALQTTSTGSENTATGSGALGDNQGGSYNSAYGNDTLLLNTSANYNAAFGWDALKTNQTGTSNTATGAQALLDNTSADDNVADGVNALFSNQTGADNTAVGTEALFASTGAQNVALGSGAGLDLTSGSDNVDIANSGRAGESKVIRIGTKGTQRKAFLAGVSGTAVSGSAEPVVVNAQGQLGTASGARSLGSDEAVAELMAENRRQASRIAALEREVAKLSKR